MPAITVKKEYLLGKLSAVKPAVATSDFRPSLLGVLIKGGKMVAHDGVTAIMVNCPSLALHALVDFQRLQRVIGAMGDNVKLSVGKKRLTLKSGRFVTALEMLPFDDYPTPPVRASSTFKPPKDFVEGLSSVVAFASDNIAFPHLCGVRVDGSDLYATDRLRVAHYRMRSSIAGGPFTIPLPAALVMAADKQPKALFVKDDGARFGAVYKGKLVVTGTLAGGFPNAADVFAAHSKGGWKVEFDGNTADAAERVALLADAESYRIRVTAEERGVLTLEAHADGVGTGAETSFVKSKKGFDFTVNPNHFAEALRCANKFRYVKPGRLYCMGGRFELLLALVTGEKF